MSHRPTKDLTPRGVAKVNLRAETAEALHELVQARESGAVVGVGEWRGDAVTGNHVLNVSIDRRPFGIEFSEEQLENFSAPIKEEKAAMRAIARACLDELLAGGGPVVKAYGREVGDGPRE